MGESLYGADPDEWLRHQEERVAALTEQADRAREQLHASDATVSSRDGSVTVTVNPGGQLQHLQLSPKVEKLTPVRLASTIMSTYQRACADATRSTMEIMSELVGDDSEVMDFLAQQLPTDPDAEDSGENR